MTVVLQPEARVPTKIDSYSPTETGRWGNIFPDYFKGMDLQPLRKIFPGSEICRRLLKRFTLKEEDKEITFINFIR